MPPHATTTIWPQTDAPAASNRPTSSFWDQAVLALAIAATLVSGMLALATGAGPGIIIVQSCAALFFALLVLRPLARLLGGR